MRVISLLMCTVASALAWLPPERCAQEGRNRRTSQENLVSAVVPDINGIAKAQNRHLKDLYWDHQFTGVPVRISCDPMEANCDTKRCNPGRCTAGLGLEGSRTIYIYVAYNCTFYTYAPRLLSSVACHTAGCKLTHTVSTMDTYTSSEGYNWGVKVSSKLSLFNKMFEIGGEASTGGTYTCTYTKGRTTTDTVECSESKKGNLHLYNVKSDMQCDFGTIRLDLDGYACSNQFTASELREIKESAASFSERCLGTSVFIDVNKISDRTLQKLMQRVPGFNPYTDLVDITENVLVVRMFRKTSTYKDFSKVIPFTNEGGDSVFQYACIIDEY